MKLLINLLDESELMRLPKIYEHLIKTTYYMKKFVETEYL
ncbi:hypothetical protein DFR98_000148 [Clostridium saccharobutylicum]|nr:hypothetical protein [Clostridium saccharobutylicum]